MKNIPDSIILWANLFILFLLFIKFAVKPIIKFVKGHKKKILEEAADLETRKKTIVREISDINKSLNEKEHIIENTEEHMIRQAEKKKSEIIKEAELESNLILGKAKQKTEDQFLREKEKLYREIRSEILSKNTDTAFGKALVNKSDNNKKND